MSSECKLHYCPGLRKENMLYCSQHEWMGEEIDILEYATDIGCDLFDGELHDDIVLSTTSSYTGQLTRVDEDEWNWLIAGLGNSWNLHPDDIDEKLREKLQPKYGNIKLV